MRSAFQPLYEAPLASCGNNCPQRNVSSYQPQFIARRTQRYSRQYEFQNYSYPTGMPGKMHYDNLHEYNSCTYKSIKHSFQQSHKIRNQRNPRRFNVKRSKSAPAARGKGEFKKLKTTAPNFSNNLLEIKPLDKFGDTKHIKCNIEQNTENINQNTKGKENLEEARRLAKSLELEIKKDIYKMNLEKNNCQQESEKNNNIIDSSKSVEQHLQTRNKQQNNGKEIGSASVLKIELEEQVDAMYEVVTLKTSEGNIVIMKNPVLLRSHRKPPEHFSSYQIPTIRGRSMPTVRRNLFKEFKLKGSYKRGFSVPLSNKTQTNSHTPVEVTSSLCETVSIQECSKSCDVIVKNISRSTKSEEIEKLAEQVGVLLSCFHDQLSGRAELTFQTPEQALRFCSKYHRKMIDLSIISVALV